MTLFNKITAFIFSSIIVLIAVFVFAIDITTNNINDQKQNISSFHINDNIEIIVNQNGIKKIKAKSNYDLFFAQGYIHAFDRMWQMDILRRQAEGRMSEVFGNTTLPVDKFIRTLNLKQIAIDTYFNVDNETKSILNAYADGVNFYLSNNKNLLTFEFDALDYKPYKWLPYHSLLISKLFAFEMSFSFWYDVTFGEIASRFNKDIALDLIPEINSYNSSEYNVIDSLENVIPTQIDSSALSSLYLNYNNNIETVSKIAGFTGGAKGSNNWSVFKNLSTPTNGAILANDPHLPLRLPSVWYQNHIQSEKINSLGYSLPGVPLVLIGRNESISWGITNMMADICDFYFEKTDESNEKYYTDNDSVKSFEYKIDTINIKNDEPHIYYQRRTDRSIVISDSHIFKDSNNLIGYTPDPEYSFFDDYVLTYNWTASKITNEIEALYKINKSSDIIDFEKATDLWGSPPLVFNYADTSGNIGLFPSGIIPKRNKQCNPNLPNPGWLKEHRWNGYYTSSNFEKSINSSSGSVFSANTKLDLYNDFFVSNYWEPQSRIIRIDEMIKESEYYATRDARFMQNDILSPYAKIILELVIPKLELYSNLLNKIESDALYLLKNWDYLMSASSSESSIYNAFITELIKNTYYDELDEKLFKQYCFISSLPTRKILNDLLTNNQFWFDDKNTDEIEQIHFIVLKSFRNSLIYLKNHFSTDNLSDWKYGQLHTLKLEHILSENDFLKPIVSQPPHPIGGNNTTINNSEYHYYDPFDVIIGASMRFIADMEEDEVYMSMPGGNSGDPIHSQYADQVRLWLNGGYIQVSFTNESEYEEFITIEKD